MVPIIHPFSQAILIRQGEIYIDTNGNYVPVVHGVPRFVEGSNYTDNFGFQWNRFQETQIDTKSTGSQNLSRERFFAETGWENENLDGKDILEVGSGAGRFSQVVLDYTKANLYSVDYSDAVSANHRNNGHHGDRLKLFQASIYEMPFPDNSFDKVFCFGVLQHTPDFKKSIKSLADKVKPGGELVVDFYPMKGWWTKVHAKYLLRPITKRWSHDVLLRRIQRNADWMMKLTGFFDKIGIGRIVNRFVPIVDIRGTLPPNLTKQELREWVILDTFDMFSPEHDHPQRISTVKKWFEESGMKVTFADFIRFGNNYSAATVRGIKV